MSGLANTYCRPPLFGDYRGARPFAKTGFAEPTWQCGLRLTLVVAAHAAIIVAALSLTVAPPAVNRLLHFEARLVSPPPPAPRAESKAPESVATPAYRPTPTRVSAPATPNSRHAREAPVTPLARRPATTPALVGSAPAPSTSILTSTSAPPAAAQPAPAAQAAAPTAPASAEIVAPRYDAAYLHNPKPAYPFLAERRREQGSVWLRVRVAADGSALQVDIQTSSGSPLLDEAALEAVRRWHFIPARHGDEAIASTVVVPIRFAVRD